jgi:PPOX class probable F420-dependent enzyme
VPLLRPEEARARFASARVARLATADAGGRPHLVPVCFALDGEELVSAVDFKPKHTTAMRRLANIEVNPQVCLLVDEYDDEDWSALWWARADGRAAVLDAAEPRAARALAVLRERYEQYRLEQPPGPVIAVAVERWTGWTASSS